MKHNGLGFQEQGSEKNILT